MSAYCNPEAVVTVCTPEGSAGGGPISTPPEPVESPEQAATAASAAAANQVFSFKTSFLACGFLTSLGQGVEYTTPDAFAEPAAGHALRSRRVRPLATSRSHFRSRRINADDRDAPDRAEPHAPPLPPDRHRGDGDGLAGR